MQIFFGLQAIFLVFSAENWPVPGERARRQREIINPSATTLYDGAMIHTEDLGSTEFHRPAGPQEDPQQKKNAASGFRSRFPKCPPPNRSGNDARRMLIENGRKQNRNFFSFPARIDYS